jgi:hypothetical protein
LIALFVCMLVFGPFAGLFFWLGGEYERHQPRADVILFPKIRHAAEHHWTPQPRHCRPIHPSELPATLPEAPAWPVYDFDAPDGAA